MRRRSDGGIIHVQVVANGSHHHFAGIEANSNLHLNATGTADVFSIRLHSGLHGESYIASTERMVLVSDRGPEYGHNAVTEHLIHGAFKSVHGVHHNVDGRIEELLGIFRIEVLNQLGGIFDVGK